MGIQFSSLVPPSGESWRLFLTTGWNNEYRLSADRLAVAFENSWHVVSAFEGKRLVGLGRVVSDGVLHAMIYDLIVDPEFQRRGIGAEILRRLVDKCREANIPDIQLFCAAGKRLFYEHHGFRARPDEAPGMEYASH